MAIDSFRGLGKSFTYTYLWEIQGSSSQSRLILQSMDSRSDNWIKSGNWTRDYELYQNSFSQHTYNSSFIYGHFRQSVFIGYPLILHLGTSCSINHLHISLQVRTPWLQIQIFCLLQKLCNFGSLPPPDLYYFRILLSPLLLGVQFCNSVLYHQPWSPEGDHHCFMDGDTSLKQYISFFLHFYFTHVSNCFFQISKNHLSKMLTSSTRVLVKLLNLTEGRVFPYC